MKAGPATERALRDKLASLYSEPKRIRHLLHNARLGDIFTHLDLSGSPQEAWFDTLRELKNRDLLVPLLDVVGSDYPRDDALREIIATVLGRSPPPPTKPVTDEPPYPGLTAYTEADQSLFYGRAHEVETCWALLSESKVLLVTGRSGAGKSSLLRAGLLPKLRSASGGELTVIDVRPGTDPFRSLADALKDKSRGGAAAVLAWNQRISACFETPRPDVLRDAVGALLESGSSHCVVIVDPLEELVSLGGDEHKKRNLFLDLLAECWELARQRGGVEARLWVLFAVRTDMLDVLRDHSRFKALCDATAQYALGPLASDALRSVIVGPVTNRADVDDGLPATIAAELGRAPGSLPLLNHLLRRMWDAAPVTDTAGRRRMSVEGYKDLGGLGGVLARTAEEAHDELNSADHVALNRVLLELVHHEEGHALRRVRSREELAAKARCDRAQLDRVLAPFEDRHLLTSNVDEKVCTVEVAHEALFKEWPRYRALVEEHGPRLRLKREVEAAALRWQAGGRGELWPDGAALRNAEEAVRAGTIDFTELERKFVSSSRCSIDVRRWWDRGAVVVLATVVAWLALERRGRMREEAQNEASHANEIRLAERVLELTPQDARAWQGLASGYANMADVLERRGDLRGALRALRAELDVWRCRALQSSSATEWQPQLAASRLRLALLYRKMDLYDEAVDSQRKALALSERFAASSPDDVVAQIRVAQQMWLLANILATCRPHPEERGEVLDLPRQALAKVRGLRQANRITAVQEQTLVQALTPDNDAATLATSYGARPRRSVPLREDAPRCPPSMARTELE